MKVPWHLPLDEKQEGPRWGVIMLKREVQPSDRLFLFRRWFFLRFQPAATVGLALGTGDLVIVILRPGVLKLVAAFHATEVCHLFDPHGRV